jgi:hypothetical protein
MAVGNIYRVSVQTTTGSSVESFNMHYEEIDPSSPDGDADLLAEAWRLAHQTAYQAVLANNVRLCNVRAWRVGIPGYPGLAIFPNVAGTVAANGLPSNKAMIFKLVQFSAGAKKNGRIFIAGISELSVVGNELDITFRAGPARTFANGLLSDLTAAGPGAGRWRLVILSKTITPPSFPWGTPLDVSEVNVNPVVGTQRRRSSKALRVNA